MSILKPITPVWQPSHPLAAYCDLFVPVHEGSGLTLADLSPGERAGTADAASWQTGDYGPELILTPAAEVNFGDYAIWDYENSAFSIEMLFKHSANSHFMFGKHTGTSGFKVYSDETGLTLNIDDSGGLGSVDLSAGVWFHLVITRNPGVEICYYLDGEAEAIGESYSMGDAAGADLLLTVDVETAMTFGMLALWHKALTPVEVASRYTNLWGPVGSGTGKRRRLLMLCE